MDINLKKIVYMLQDSPRSSAVNLSRINPFYKGTSRTENPLFGGLLCFFAAWGIGIPFAAGQDRALPVQRRVTDSLSLKSGERLLGMFVGEPEENTRRAAVDRAWLRENHRRLYDRAVAEEADRVRKALLQLQGRLRRWREDRKDSPRMVAFLDRELARLDRRLVPAEQAAKDAEPAPDAAPYRLLLLEIPAKEVRAFYAQPPAHRRMLALAWERGWENVDQESAANLAERFRRERIDPNAVEPDPSDLFPPHPLNDAQWAARRALVEFSFVSEPEFQGTETVLLRVRKGERQPDLFEAAAPLLQEALSGLSRVSEDDKQRPDPVKSAIQQAASDGFSGLKITQLRPDPARGEVTVTGRFLARTAKDSWVVVWEGVEIASAKGASEDTRRRIKADPRIAGLLDSLKTLGLDANSPTVETAIRFGAATMEAQQRTDEQFQKFLLRSTRRLDAPEFSRLLWSPVAKGVIISELRIGE